MRLWIQCFCFKHRITDCSQRAWTILHQLIHPCSSNIVSYLWLAAVGLTRPSRHGGMQWLCPWCRSNFGTYTFFWDPRLAIQHPRNHGKTSFLGCWLSQSTKYRWPHIFQLGLLKKKNHSMCCCAAILPHRSRQNWHIHSFFDTFGRLHMEHIASIYKSIRTKHVFLLAAWQCGYHPHRIASCTIQRPSRLQVRSTGLGSQVSWILCRMVAGLVGVNCNPWGQKADQLF